jgi:hypothetical protein
MLTVQACFRRGRSCSEVSPTRRFESLWVRQVMYSTSRSICWRAAGVWNCAAMTVSRRTGNSADSGFHDGGRVLEAECLRAAGSLSRAASESLTAAAGQLLRSGRHRSRRNGCFTAGALSCIDSLAVVPVPFLIGCQLADEDSEFHESAERALAANGPHTALIRIQEDPDNSSRSGIARS